LTLAWSILRYYVARRPRAKVTLSWGLVQDPAVPAGQALIVTIANLGQLPITLNDGGLYCPDGTRVTVNPGTGAERLPFELRHGKRYRLYTALAPMQDDYARLSAEGNAPTHGYFMDCTGRYYKARIPKWMVERVLAKHAATVANNPPPEQPAT